ncbi:MAG: alpha/beta hydrolase [Novosphingobium sp.]
MANDPLGKVAPDLQKFIELLPDLSNIGARIDEVRAVLSPPTPLQMGDDGTIVTEEAMIARADGSMMRALVVRPSTPKAAKMPVILHVHGGGYVAGTTDYEHDDLYRDALNLGCVVISPDYRLAPEHPYPAPLEDVLLAWDWIHSGAGGLGIDPARSVVRGVSAGGGLACAAVLKLRDKGAPLPALLMAIYPMLDDRTPSHAHNGAYVWTHENNVFGWDSYLAGVDRDNPPVYAVPGREEDWSQMPPVFLASGSIDLFIGENLAFARKLADAGVAVEMHVYPGAYHGFPRVPCEAGQALGQAASAAIARAFA